LLGAKDPKRKKSKKPPVEHEQPHNPC